MKNKGIINPSHIERKIEIMNELKNSLFMGEKIPIYNLENSNWFKIEFYKLKPFKDLGFKDKYCSLDANFYINGVQIDLLYFSIKTIGERYYLFEDWYKQKKYPLSPKILPKRYVERKKVLNGNITKLILNCLEDVYNETKEFMTGESNQELLECYKQYETYQDKLNENKNKIKEIEKENTTLRKAFKLKKKKEAAALKRKNAAMRDFKC